MAKSSDGGSGQGSMMHLAKQRRSPSHPGEIFRKDFREPANITQVDAARRLGVPLARLNAIERGKRGISPETALLFAAMTRTSPEFWMQLQARYDLWHAFRNIGPAKVKAIGKRAPLFPDHASPARLDPA